MSLALISVHEKSGVVEFARSLVDEFGMTILSTGGTAALLERNRVPVQWVESVTGFPELMDGRVKTLHPRIHAAILADRDQPHHLRQLTDQGITPIDLVAVNLYPFEKIIADPGHTFEQAVEMIDIGGPCLLRAAAKNHRHVFIVTASSPDGYETALNEFRSIRRRSEHEADLRRRSAARAFALTNRYDRAIADWFQTLDPASTATTRVFSWRVLGPLRYGENPDQKAEVLIDPDRCPLLDSCETAPGVIRTASLVDAGHVPDMSYNNYLDGHAALELCKELDRAVQSGTLCAPDLDRRRSDPAPRKCNAQTSGCVAVLVKHGNPCGAGLADDPLEAFRRAYLGDPNAAMGGVLAVNTGVDPASAEAVMDAYATWGKEAGAGGFFVEVWIAPHFDDDAINCIRHRKSWGSRVRLLSVGILNGDSPDHGPELRTITGGALLQSTDLGTSDPSDWHVVTKRPPTPAEWVDLLFAWFMAKHTKSNAISLTRNGMLIGNGAGQMSRVMSARVATWLARENGHAEQLSGAAAASDAFFPFADGPGLLMDAGVRALIQPGGSKRDAETITACDLRDAAMVFTGRRHFRH